MARDFIDGHGTGCCFGRPGCLGLVDFGASKKQTLLKYAHRQVVPWGVIDLIAVVLLAIFIQGGSLRLSGSGGTIQGASFESAGGMIVFSIASVTDLVCRAELHHRSYGRNFTGLRSRKARFQ